MSASLVGSEMCIRDRKFMCEVEGRLGGGTQDLQEAKLLNRITRWTPEGLPVSYTHLTLPTICSV
eukprot:7899214-Alexandrium_andersonii.AAC.1